MQFGKRAYYRLLLMPGLASSFRYAQRDRATIFMLHRFRDVESRVEGLDPTHMPLPPWSQLYRTPKLVLTHYSSVNSPRAQEDAFEQFTSGLEQLRETGEPPNRVV